MKAWYLLYCKAREEQRAQQNLALQELETYLPMMTCQKRTKGGLRVSKTPLFPSYIFIHFDPLQTSVGRIHSTRGVVRLVGCKEDITPIDDRIIHGLKLRELSLSATEGTFSGLEPAEVELKSGDRIRFSEGPFAELEGIFEEQCANKRCFVLFDILGQQKKVAVPQSSVKRICE
ncbi:transcription/translation regulatory transformer protein RfaH [Shewanella salipaludis]|uniref:Transcription antitermination protein RfaH n=1 Tax=Shewanella salipaludis TaxID=2723052 RepID=A0A972JIZ0_9GAMM|nr:transcription/translation regulatory transformer protein RfaH [Shewanella salipaludis]NMH65588.1 transcription/translation regulatory transformer protein RfaH [Shewanella salipaludis]